MANWAIAHSGMLCVRSWDDDGLNVVYDVNSGDTHLLDDLSLKLIQLVEMSAFTTSGLTELVADFFAEGEPQDMFDYVDATLLKLRATGLVSIVTP